ncbi:MAG: acyl-[acyl-carrier-protein] desaturase, partial [Mycobacterium sp.]|nr:acyl-[acyl-carrier-protein] desaturase [Mycobacterium sp.]
MAQKPVADALILELEPVVQQELRRHIDTEDLWYA